ncbi:transporter substrate-binding domain-containing protein [Vibrio sp.]|uniref:substrate-binding periplasmic protein n=1 Tax=Vibrio sp. TaxID=678 RepID=UPI003120490C
MTRIYLVLICALVTFSFKSYASNHLQQVKICLADDAPWVPYTIWDESLSIVKTTDITGILPDVIKEIFSKTRYQYVISPMPRSKVMQNMQSKESECDIALSANLKQERIEVTQYTLPLYKFGIGYFYTGSDSVWVDFSNINKNEACGIIGYNYDSFNYKNDIKLVANVSKALSLLSKNRCQIFLSEIDPILYGMEQGLYQIDQEIYESQDNLLYKVINEKVYHLIVNKQSQNAKSLLAELNQRLVEIHDDGTSDAIKSKYLKDFNK